MFPVLAHIDGLSIDTFVVATILAFAVPAFLFVADNREFVASRLSGGLVLWLCLGMEVGCRLYWHIQYEPLSDLFRFQWLWHAGRVSYGGFVGGIAAAAVYCRIHGIRFGEFVDRVSPYLPLPEAFVRIGCFAAGCCWGTPTNLPWGVQYPQSCLLLFNQQLVNGLMGPTDAYTFPTHPVQLYSVAAMCALFVGLMYARKLTLPEGGHFMLYLASYGAVRFVLEFWRGDCTSYLSGTFTISQMLSAALAIIASAILISRCRSVFSRKAPGLET